MFPAYHYSDCENFKVTPRCEYCDDELIDETGSCINANLLGFCTKVDSEKQMCTISLRVFYDGRPDTDMDQVEMPTYTWNMLFTHDNIEEFLTWVSDHSALDLENRSSRFPGTWEWDSDSVDKIFEDGYFLVSDKYHTFAVGINYAVFHEDRRRHYQKALRVDWSGSEMLYNYDHKSCGVKLHKDSEKEAVRRTKVKNSAPIVGAVTFFVRDSEEVAVSKKFNPDGRRVRLSDVMKERESFKKELIET